MMCCCQRPWPRLRSRIQTHTEAIHSKAPPPCEHGTARHDRNRRQDGERPHPALVQHEDAVSIHHSAQAVRHNDSGAAAAHLGQRALNHALREAVQRRSSLLHASR